MCAWSALAAKLTPAAYPRRTHASEKAAKTLRSFMNEALSGAPEPSLGSTA